MINPDLFPPSASHPEVLYSEFDKLVDIWMVNSALTPEDVVHYGTFIDIAWDLWADLKMRVQDLESDLWAAEMYNEHLQDKIKEQHDKEENFHHGDCLVCGLPVTEPTCFCMHPTLASDEDLYPTEDNSSDDSEGGF